ncbi:MAG TPA: DNA internalization-related competence protein ComEC/Rec2, partial [Ideonella sp.]|nr:DNA internalization-related competence protein ComEC/Rec2 [Ideonella sp.]
ARRAGAEPGAAAAPQPAPRWRRAWVAVRAGLRSQWVATLGLAPLSLLFFQQLSLVGLLANLVAVPVITLVITPLALLGLLWAPLWAVADWALQPLLGWLGWLSGWPLAVWTVPAASGWAGAAALLGGALLVLPLPWRLRALGLPLLLPLLAPAVARPAEGRFELVAADVGQGSAVLVRTREHLLVHDSGARFSRDSDAGRQVLLPLLQARGERRIDELVLSHRDLDHVGGAAALLDKLPVARLRSSLEAGHPLLARPLPQIPCHAGQAWVWDGVRFEVLHPGPEPYPAGARPNTLSCVLRVQGADGHSALLTGDIEAGQEQALVARLGPALRSEVLLVPHHGSQTSSSEAFLAAVQPRVAVMQLGYRNRFGHPHASVLAGYAGAGVPVVRTDRCGAWLWTAAGASCTRDVRRRYWHWRLQAMPPGGGAVVARVTDAGEPE